MITHKKGNLLNETDCIIAHQVNCRGVMGAGVAKQIKKQLLTKKNFDRYRELCYSKTPSELLGHVQLCKTSDGVIVANLFAEDIPTGNRLDTDYNALRNCFINLRAYASKALIKKFGSFDKAIKFCEIRQKTALFLNETLKEVNDNTSNEADLVYTDMKNLKKSMDILISKYSLPKIAIPKYIGCGLAGGDWNIVYNMLKELFDEYPVDLLIVEL